MVFHPPGIVVEIVGTEAGNQGRSCKEHPTNCGKVFVLSDRASFGYSILASEEKASEK